MTDRWDTWIDWDNWNGAAMFPLYENVHVTAKPRLIGWTDEYGNPHSFNGRFAAVSPLPFNIGQIVWHGLSQYVSLRTVLPIKGCGND